MKKILVTGSEGYIGKPLCALIRSVGWDVVGLDLRTGWDATRDPLPPLDEFYAVIPLAAVVGAPACEKDPERARRIIVDGAREIADKLRPDQRCIYLTTDSGCAPGNGVTESEPFYPRSVYAKLKHEASEILRAKGAVVLRLASLFGVAPSMRDDLLVHFLIRETVAHGRVPILFGASTRRSFVHVDDVVQEMMMTLLADGMRYGRIDGVGPVVNLVSEEFFTKADVALRVALAAGVDPRSVVAHNTPDGDIDGRDFWLDGGKSGWACKRRLALAIPGLVEYYRKRSAK